MATIKGASRCSLASPYLFNSKYFLTSSSRLLRSRPSIARRHGYTAGYATDAPTSQKPYYLTTPIFYVNAAPHVGHLFTMVLADTFKRWQLLLGNTNVQLLTGTDEHGMKIQKAAQNADMDTQAFCDMNCQTFKNLANTINLSHDNFIRTTDAKHKDAVRYFWEMLQHRGHIYTTKHEGWYSVSDETFYPQSQVQPTLDPATGRKIMISIETGKEVEWSAETNYHFRLSAFKDRLLKFYEENPDFIRPAHYRAALIKSVESGLPDLSVSRPVERLTWGVRVPGDESQTIYVWLDALISYITNAGYPFTPGKESESGWPVDMHIVGKDIIRFHCVYWPAFLMALDLPLPRNVLVHGHWTMNKEKMAKSTGNVVNPFFAIDRFEVDTVRFFLMNRAPMESDSDYDNDYITHDYKKHLQNGIGNTAHRLLGVAEWDLQPCFEAVKAGLLDEPTEEDEKFVKLLRGLPAKVKEGMDILDPKRSLHAILDMIRMGQNYLHAKAPWQYKIDPSQGYRAMYNVSESVRICSILLQPFMPQKSTEMLDLLGVKRDFSARGFSAAVYGSDLEYGFVKKNWKIVFRKLLIED